MNSALSVALLVSMAAVLGYQMRQAWRGVLPAFGEFVMMAALAVAWSILLFGSCG